FALPSPCPTSSQLSTLSLHDALPICYDPIEVGVSDPGGTIVTPLPDSWVTGLAEGSLRGLFAWPGETQQYVVLGDHNTYQWYTRDRKSTRLNSSHVSISYAVFCLKKK